MLQTYYFHSLHFFFMLLYCCEPPRVGWSKAALRQRQLINKNISPLGVLEILENPHLFFFKFYRFFFPFFVVPIRHSLLQTALKYYHSC